MNRGARGYQETLLVDTLDRMRRNPEGREVVHLHLSQLLPHHRTPVRLKITMRLFRALESSRQIQIFTMSNDDLAAYTGTQAGQDLKAMIRERKKGRTILARCDNEAAVKVGQQLGITMFQGRYIDGLGRSR